MCQGGCVIVRASHSLLLFANKTENADIVNISLFNSNISYTYFFICIGSSLILNDIKHNVLVWTLLVVNIIVRSLSVPCAAGVFDVTSCYGDLKTKSCKNIEILQYK